MRCFRVLAVVLFSAFALPAAAQPVTETCGVFVRQGAADAEQTDYIPVFGYSVTNAALPLAAPPGQARIDGILCDRLTLELRPNDYRVLTDLRVPFYVRSGIRLVALEVADGQFRVRFLSGAPTEAERAQLADALDRVFDALEAAPPANAGQ
ncbi:MAG: hypothetical protein K2P58_07400 [Hyphomonadaceae bacterium]|nr:hypothetical protein [Hyphomonadaceae bacterium]